MRLTILFRLIASVVLLLWAGLFWTQVLQGGDYRRQAERNRTRLIHLPAARGQIVDRNGVALAQDRLRFELSVFPQEMKNASFTWKRLSKIVGLPPEELNRRYRKGYQAPFQLVSLVRDVKPQVAFLLEEDKDRLAGVVVRPIPSRFYPLGEAIGSVAGYIGLISQEELTHLKGYGYSFRDRVGKDGLEQVYDRYLRGHDGGLHLEVDAHGRMVRQLGSLIPQQGRQIRVSIDSRLQSFCHQLLKKNRGSIVVMDVASGEVLALVSTPSFDPNLFLDPNRLGELQEELQNSQRPFFNRATRAMVPPGSTFKVAVAYEALKKQAILPQTSFECPGSYTVGSSVFRCWESKGHGMQNVTDALTHSCNVFFYHTGRKLGVEGIGQAARLFGLGRPTGIDLPREEDGFVPTSAWMVQTYKQPWQLGDTLSFAVGQGGLQATPLQMLQMMTLVARGGSEVTPHLLLEIQGETLPKSHLSRRSVNLLSDPEALTVVRIGLDRVVNSPSGTGRLVQESGVPAAGKTGTAQAPPGTPHAWFIGYAPHQIPKVSFVVFLEHGGQGGYQGALVVRDLMSFLRELALV